MRQKKETRGRPRVLTPKQRAKNAQMSMERWRKANTKIISIRFRIVEDKQVFLKLVCLQQS